MGIFEKNIAKRSISEESNFMNYNIELLELAFESELFKKIVKKYKFELKLIKKVKKLQPQFGDFLLER